VTAFEYLSQMITGAGGMRFLLQPLIAIVIGVLMGRHDSHDGRGAFWQGVRSRKQGERPLLQGLKRVAVPFCLAIVLSLVFQFINMKEMHLLHAVMAAVCLVALPYVVARDVSARIDVWWHRTHPRKLAH
jgi:hypothetical protein